jgi:hypothetical protein
MGKASGKTDKIKAALAKGTLVKDVARKYEVTLAYVYTLRKRMNAQPTPVKKPARKPARKPAARPVLVMPLVSPQPLEVQVAAPAVTVVTPPPPLSRWQLLKNFFRGVR